MSMRIACVHVPQFALQCVTRIDPSLRGAPIVVVGAALDPGGGAAHRVALHGPIVLACSRAAWALGVRIGMTAAAARALAPSELEVVTADPQLEHDTLRALADVLLGASSVVDIGGRVGPGGAHLAVYCEVPSKTRGTSFGERLLERLETLGLTGRIGIADDRYTAWVAAWVGAWDPARPAPDARTERTERPDRDEQLRRLGDEIGVVSVPRGGSAAFLAPRPLSLLSITPEVQHMLEALGVRTLGEFAALPAPSVARPLEADYQALARGDSGTTLRPYTPDAPIREAAVVGTGPHALSGPAAVALLAERIALRLGGRGRSAVRLEVTLVADGAERMVPITPAAPARVLTSAESIAEALGTVLGEDAGAAKRLRIAVIGEAVAGDAADPVETPIQRTMTIAARSSHDRPGETGDGRDTLALVLSTTGGTVDRMFGLTSPAFLPARRDAHRRTRRGKQRRRTRTGEVLVQPRLFKM